MQVRYLESIDLYKSTKTKQANGSYINTYSKQSTYRVQFQEILDEPSVSMYGATINKMYRISSPLRALEKLLKTKMNDNSDNISLYYVLYNNAYYKITAVKKHWIDIEYKENVASN